MRQQWFPGRFSYGLGTRLGLTVLRRRSGNFFLACTVAVAVYNSTVQYTDIPHRTSTYAALVVVMPKNTIVESAPFLSHREYIEEVKQGLETMSILTVKPLSIFVQRT